MGRRGASGVFLCVRCPAGALLRLPLKSALALALEPGKTGRLPAFDRTAMPVLVERTFETAGDIVAGAVSRRRHRLRRGHAPAPRTANEEEVVIELHAERPELTGEALSEERVHGLIGKGLPFDQDSPFT